MRRLKLTLLVILSFASAGLRGEVMVKDDLGNSVRLERPATRIVSLSPHLTEMVFAAGAGDKLIGVVSYSDYPPAALKIPVIGSYQKINYESLVALQPDLVLVWNSGNGPEIVERIKGLGLAVFVNEPKRLPDIADSVAKIGVLASTEKTADQSSVHFIRTYNRLKANNKKTPVKVFLQLWNEPMMTVNGSHIMSDAISVCGGVNVFADAVPLIPRINIESVVQRNPDIIIATGMADERPEWLNYWLVWGDMGAVQNDNLHSINPDILSRHSPRILQGVAQLCDYFDKARDKLK